jgi:hypothetical protein
MIKQVITAVAVTAGLMLAPVAHADSNCATAIQVAIAGAAQGSAPTGIGYRAWLPMPGWTAGNRPNMAMVTVPTPCANAFLADVHAKGVASSGGDQQLMTDGLIACRTSSAGTFDGGPISRDDTAIQVQKAEGVLAQGVSVNVARDIVDSALAQLCPPGV